MREETDSTGHAANLNKQQALTHWSSYLYFQISRRGRCGLLTEPFFPIDLVPLVVKTPCYLSRRDSIMNQPREDTAHSSNIRGRRWHDLCVRGIWGRWIDPQGKALETFTILTTTPNTLLSVIHNRKPVILNPGDYDVWLPSGSTEAVLSRKR